MAGAKVTVKPATWRQVRPLLKRTFEGDEREIRRDVESGAAFCWLIGDVAMISRLDGKELVVMCLAGENLPAVAPLIKAAAKRAGCKSMRAHTKRPALQKLLESIDMKIDEYILRVTL